MRMVFAAVATATLALSACSSSPDQAAQQAAPSPKTSAPRSYSAKSDVALQQCMGDKGWKIDVQPNGGFKANVPPDQQNKYLGDQDACVKLFEEAHPAPKLTTADYKALYQQELTTMRCLDKAGYPAPTSPISEQQYVDEYASGNAPTWYAYLAVGNLSGDAFAKVEKQCPQPRVDK